MSHFHVIIDLSDTHSVFPVRAVERSLVSRTLASRSNDLPVLDRRFAGKLARSALYSSFLLRHTHKMAQDTTNDTRNVELTPPRPTYRLIVSPLTSPIRESDSDMLSDNEISDKGNSDKLFCTGCLRMIKRKHMKMFHCDWNHGLCKVNAMCAYKYKDYRCPVCATDLRQNAITTALEASLVTAREDNMRRKRSEIEDEEKEAVVLAESLTRIESDSEEDSTETEEGKEESSESEFEVSVSIQNKKRSYDTHFVMSRNAKRSAAMRLVEEEIWSTHMGRVRGIIGRHPNTVLYTYGPREHVNRSEQARSSPQNLDSNNTNDNDNEDERKDNEEVTEIVGETVVSSDTENTIVI